jgi:hypothetical protein
MARSRNFKKSCRNVQSSEFDVMVMFKFCYRNVQSYRNVQISEITHGTTRAYQRKRLFSALLPVATRCRNEHFGLCIPGIRVSR